eukprot:TRINITY_DN727_c0_g1_i4.p1 TRINITY_DN727_c0_g1~~TRINITY_DN727_c0_g1_i4.p1  ORF type:complete len:428 (+),score=68.65 TRINITY_DN727_c0_g1_i4:143-1426(+)
MEMFNNTTRYCVWLLLVVVSVFLSGGHVTLGFGSPSTTLPPFIFSPGFAASDLVATVEPGTQIAGCPHLGSDPFVIWVNNTIFGKYNECFYNLMRLVFDSTTQTYASPPGVSISTHNFGSVLSMQSMPGDYSQFFEDVVIGQWGYISEQNAFIVPYDWRLAGKSLQAAGWCDDFQALVEMAYETNNNTRVGLSAHSNGPPTVYYFLTECVSQQWKDTYIAAFIPLSGNFGGQINGLEPLISNEPPGFIFNNRTLDRYLQGTWETTYWSTPFAPVDDDRVIITAFAAHPSETRNYTVYDVPSLLSEYLLYPGSTWAEQYNAVYPQMNRTESPMVDTYCFYGLGVPTSLYYRFNRAPVLTRANYVGDGNGDGDQDYLDNEFCNIWASQLRDNGHTFVATAFEGVSHMEMVSNTTVLNAILDVLINQSKV